MYNAAREYKGKFTKILLAFSAGLLFLILAMNTGTIQFSDGFAKSDASVIWLLGFMSTMSFLSFIFWIIQAFLEHSEGY